MPTVTDPTSAAQLRFLLAAMIDTARELGRRRRCSVHGSPM